MEDSLHNPAKFCDRTKNLIDNIEIKQSETEVVKRQKPTFNKLRDRKIYKDLTENVFKQSDEIETAVPRCTDEESDLLVANCCRGFLVHNTEYIMKNEAIETTTKPSLCLSTENMTTVKKEFCTQIEMNSFEEGLTSAGSCFNISFSPKESKKGTSNNSNDSSKKGISSHCNDSSKKVKNSETEKVFIAIAHYSLVPVNSIQLFEQNLKLTPLALKEIQKIEELISNMGEKNKAITDICCKFINTFGSHVCNGNIDVGGILKTSTVYESETKLTVEKCQDFAKQAHAAYIKHTETAAAEASFCFTDGRNKETNSNADESKLTFSCSQLSFPSKHWNHAEWCKNLVNNSGAWCVIGRGSPTGIWNILLNHRNEIPECYRIAAILRNAWQNEWNQTSNERLDQIVQCGISSIVDFISRIENFSQNVVEVIDKMTRWASLNHRFKEYVSVTKFVSFFKNTVTKNNELHLKHKVCLKILVGMLGLSTLNEHEDVLRWFKTPLLNCEENVFESIIHFMNNELKPIYTNMSYDNAEQHWKTQVNEQITTEIALIIKHHGKHFNDKTQCIYIARCVTKLAFDFETMQISYLHGDIRVEDLFFTFPQEKVKMLVSKDLQFEKLIKRDFFRAWHISKSIYKKYNELQLNQAFVDELSNLCEKTIKEAGDQIDLGTALLIATLGFDLKLMKFNTDIDPLSSIIEEQFKIYSLVWNLQNGHIFFEDHSCYHVISALNSVFIKTVETLEKKVPKCIEQAQTYIFSLRSNILTQLQNTRTPMQRECIMLEIIVSKAFQNMTKNRVFQLNSSREFRILVDDMASSLNKSSKQVSLYPRPIPPNPDPFVVFLRECVLSLWRNSRTQMVNRCESDTGHEIKVLDDFFKSELGCLCTSSLRSCLVTVPGDVRSHIVHQLSNQSTVNCKEVERILDEHDSWLKWFLMRFFSVFVFLYNKADQFAYSTISAFQETFKKDF